jgi:hypothetical protein
MYLTDIYRTFHPKSKEYTFFSATHDTASKIEHIISNKSDLNRYRTIEIIPCILSDHYRLKLVFNNNINNRKPTLTWKPKHTLLNFTLVKEEIKKEIKDCLEFNENEATTYKLIKHNEKLGVVVHSFTPSTQEADAGRFLSSRKAWSTK